jgi:peptide chain release factor 1
MFDKLEEVLIRFEDVTNLISDPEVIADQTKFQKYAKEHSELKPVVEKYLEYKKIKEEVEDAQLILSEADDSEMKELAQMEISEGKEKLSSLESELKILLLPKDPYDDKNIFLEIRAGTGGDEASLFSAALLRMYIKYAESLKWKTEIVDFNETGVGGFKEVVLLIKGQGAYSKLKYEAGGHRVQRIPETESGGRVHTSACTVAVLPEADDVSDVNIEQKDLRIDVYRASGAGGQHVNTTDSAVRITHLPTGIVVACQAERSQHMNRAKAMKMLRAKIYEMKLDEKRKDMEKFYGNKGEIAWGSQIRSYVMQPYTMVKDHRCGVETSNVQKVLGGDIQMFIEGWLKKKAEEKG